MRKEFPLLTLLPAYLHPRADCTADEHCDAETLNAFRERTLRPQERAVVARHLSLCSDCRAVLALSSAADIPSFHAERAPANVPLQWLYSGAALAALCLAALFLPSTKVPSSTEIVTAPHPTFSPKLAAARIASPVLPGITPIWRVNSSRNPASLEISYDNRRTWRTIYLPNAHPKSVAWQGSNVWVANADGAILQSNDGGLHWTRLPPAFHISAVEASSPTR